MTGEKFVGIFSGYGPANVVIFIFHSLHGLQFPSHFLALQLLYIHIHDTPPSQPFAC